MEQIENVVDVLKNWRKYSYPDSTRGRSHSDMKHIKGHEEVAAKRILQRNWNGRLVVISMFKMAQYVESALDLKLKWLERYHLARLLMSALTFAGFINWRERKILGTLGSSRLRNKHTLRFSEFVKLELVKRKRK